MSTDSITEDFPHLTIPRHSGMTTYESIMEVHVKLKSNAALHHSELGKGSHGLLVLVLSPATHQTITSVPFVAPVNPWSLPTIVENLIASQINETVWGHKKQLRVWRE